MLLNSIGIYGFLSRAHIEHALAGDQRVANASATIDARLDAKQADLDGIKARIAQLDQIKTVTTKGHQKTAAVGVQGPAPDKSYSSARRLRLALADLRNEKAKVNGERKAVEADLGSVRYLETLLGSTDEQTMRPLHPDRGAAARSGRRPAAVGDNASRAPMTQRTRPPSPLSTETSWRGP
jgi:hypothetical protein